LHRYGPATKTDSRRSLARVTHDGERRLAAKQALRYPPVEITGIQAVTVVAGFAKACQEGGYRIHACAVLPEHVHLVVGAHPRDIRQIVGHAKSRATRLLRESGQWHEEKPLWGDHGWNVRLEDLPAVTRAIGYVNANPEKEGKKRQRWSLVTPFDLTVAREAALAPKEPPRRIGGAALHSRDEARRKRRGLRR